MKQLRRHTFVGWQNAVFCEHSVGRKMKNTQIMQLNLHVGIKIIVVLRVALKLHTLVFKQYTPWNSTRQQHY